MEVKRGIYAQIKLNRCPHSGCGRLNVYVLRRLREKKTHLYSRIVKKSVGFENYEDKMSIDRRIHPHRYLSLFASNWSDLNQNPVINPPKSKGELTKEQKQFFTGLRELEKCLTLVELIAPIIFQKYPHIWEMFKVAWKSYFEPSFRVWHDLLNSMTDDRWHRSLIEWIPIFKQAMEDSPGAASRKYYGVTTDGRRIHLSANHIKNKKLEVAGFVLDFNNYGRYLFAFVSMIMYIVRKNSKLREIYELMELEFDSQTEYLLYKIWKEVGDDDNNNQDNDHSKYYEYFETKYFDRELYEKQKLEWHQGKRKSNPDGWKYCHTVKAHQLPTEKVQELRRKRDVRGKHTHIDRRITN